MGFNFLRKREVERLETGAYNIGQCSWRDEQRDVDQMGDCSTKQDQNDGKFCLRFYGERWVKGD